MSVRVGFPGRGALDPARDFLAQVQGAVAALGQSWEVAIPLPLSARAPPRTLGPRRGPAPPQPGVARVLDWFTFGTTRMPARDLFALSDADRDRMVGDTVERFLDGVLSGRQPPNPGALHMSLGYRFKALVVSRFEQGGGDGLVVLPLTAAHLRRKARLGYPSTVGTMTEQSLRAVRGATPVARRTR